jgi:hypothetical protein
MTLADVAWEPVRGVLPMIAGDVFTVDGCDSLFVVSDASEFAAHGFSRDGTMNLDLSAGTFKLALFTSR